MNFKLSDVKKAIITIIIYIFYQENVIISLFEASGIKFSLIYKPIRIFIFIIFDLMYLIPIIYMFKDDIKNGINDIKKNFNKRFNLSVKCWLIGCIIMIISSYIINFITKQDTSKNEELVRQGIKLAPFYMLFTCSIVAPLFEEMVFRKSISILIKNKYVFIITSGLLFGFLHVLGSSKSALDYLYIIPYGSMGCAFAYLLSKTKNINLPILLHMTHNTILVIMQLFRG